MAQGQIFVMTGSLGPDLLFETLISNFEPIQKELFFHFFFSFWPKIERNCHFMIHLIDSD